MVAVVAAEVVDEDLEIVVDEALVIEDVASEEEEATEVVSEVEEVTVEVAVAEEEVQAALVHQLEEAFKPSQETGPMKCCERADR